MDNNAIEDLEVGDFGLQLQLDLLMHMMAVLMRLFPLQLAFKI